MADSLEKMLLGTGIGLDTVTFYDLIVRMEYTFNIEGDHGFFLHVRKEF